MHTDAVVTLRSTLSGRFVRFSCATLLLLLALNTQTFASQLPSPSHETLLSPSQLASLTGSVSGGDTGHEAEISKGVFTNNSSARTKGAPVPAVEKTDTHEKLVYTSVLEKRNPDWNGILRDSGVLFGAQAVAAGLTLLTPESFSGWSAEEKRNSFKKYGNNFVHPVIDKDKFYINYILHPYWGATYYTRARERGFDQGSSFLYSTLMSALYEFGSECFYEKPSIQDLIVTPVLGSVLGAYVFEPWRESIKRKPELRWYDHAALVATDPIGVLSLGFEKMFGLKPTIMIDYKVPQLQQKASMEAAGSTLASRNSGLGLVLQFPLN